MHVEDPTTWSLVVTWLLLFSSSIKEVFNGIAQSCTFSIVLFPGGLTVVFINVIALSTIHPPLYIFISILVIRTITNIILFILNST